jgi:hypothetical protein
LKGDGGREPADFQALRYDRRAIITQGLIGDAGFIMPGRILSANGDTSRPREHDYDRQDNNKKFAKAKHFRKDSK